MTCKSLNFTIFSTFIYSFTESDGQAKFAHLFSDAHIRSSRCNFDEVCSSGSPKQ